MIVSYLFCALILFIGVLLETSILSNIMFLPAIPDIVLICTMYFSIYNGRTQGETMGFMSGLVLDFLGGAPFGFNSLIRTVLGYFTGYLKKMINLKSVFVTMLFGCIATLAKALMVYLVSLFYPNFVNSYNVFSLVFLVELILNSLLTPVIFKLLDCFSNFIIIDKNQRI
ncbi:MAG: rod shape-determining protein MreD [Treponema sp.]|nr:rod shape-determining protein MreD [Treponema sp.]